MRRLIDSVRRRSPRLGPLPLAPAERPARRRWAWAALCLPLWAAIALSGGMPATAAPVAAGPAVEVRYSLPAAAPAPVLRRFDAVGRYDAGHRGVDVAVPPGTRALASADGEVSFAGPVAGRGVVVVTHADGIRTTYEPVDAAVSVGQRVARGDPLGVVTGAHGDFPVDSALHWGARRGDDYLDPLSLLRPLGPVRLVL